MTTGAGHPPGPSPHPTEGETMTDTRTRVRANDRDTSWAAAAAQTEGQVAAVQRSIYEALEDLGPMTDRELEDLVGASPSSVRTRRRELEVAGWVTPLLDDRGAVVTQRAKLKGGKLSQPQTTWRAVRDDEEPPPVRETGPQRAARLRAEAAAQEPAADAEVADAARHERGMAVARRASIWHTGDDEWASVIVDAYLHPERVTAELDREMGL